MPPMDRQPNTRCASTWNGCANTRRRAPPTTTSTSHCRRCRRATWRSRSFGTPRLLRRWLRRSLRATTRSTTVAIRCGAWPRRRSTRRRCCGRTGTARAALPGLRRRVRGTRERRSRRKARGSARTAWPRRAPAWTAWRSQAAFVHPTQGPAHPPQPSSKYREVVIHRDSPGGGERAVKIRGRQNPEASETKCHSSRIDGKNDPDF